MKFTIQSFIIFLTLSVLIHAQDFSGIKICINPGHGGHDSNDRFIPATGFWESEGNLEKGLYLRSILEKMNATIVMTRTLNRTEDDLPLSQIVQIANTNNVDIMHAIHSNAFNTQSNYTLMLFQGKDNAPTYPDSKVLSDIMGPEIRSVNRTTTTTSRGDFDFYGTGQPYLGVFKGLNMPGVLSEGSFHDYVPESWRLRNNAYLHHESWAIARSFVEFFNLGQLQHGVAAGIVRDPLKGVSYFALANNNDNKKPINSIVVTLQPGNKVFYGDTLNNGFFMFDSLAPGEYKLYYEAEGYYSDSSTVNVIADKTVFGDKFLQFDTTIAPVVLSHLTQGTGDSVKTISTFKFAFSRPMDRESTESALVFNPPAQGTFKWENSDQTMIFTPHPPLESASQYSASLSTAAKSIWNFSIPEEYSFNFVTGMRNQITYEGSYPENNADSTSGTVQIRLYFDAPISQASLSSKINLYNSANERLSVKNVKVFSEKGRGLIYFEPKDPLPHSSLYKVVLSEGITDTAGYPLLEDKEINFITDPELILTSLFLNDFESIEGWQLTKSADAVTASFARTTQYKFNGSASGKLDYNFGTVLPGKITLSNSSVLTAAAAAYPEFSLWVFGDLSFNQLEYSVSKDSAVNNILKVDTINWTGWKLRSVPVPASFLENESVYLNFMLANNDQSINAGLIYFDDAQFASIVTDVKEDMISPSKFILYQNYPNPFNPETIIRYSIPERTNVNIKIFDALGREITTLVNEQKETGTYAVSFNMNERNLKLASGVYFYSLRAGDFIATKKFILMK